MDHVVAATALAYLALAILSLVYRRRRYRHVSSKGVSGAIGIPQVKHNLVIVLGDVSREEIQSLISSIREVLEKHASSTVKK